MLTADPLGRAGVEDQGVSTTNAKKHRRRVPWEASELEIQERPPSMLYNVDDAPLGGAGGEDPGASTTNAKKHRWWSA
jgi:hypothetical protein